MSNYFQRRLKELRGDRTKAEFAAFLGFAPPVYQRYEDGRIPRAEYLSVIADKCGTTVEELLHPPTGRMLMREDGPCYTVEKVAVVGADRVAKFQHLEEAVAALEENFKSQIANLKSEIRRLKQ